MGQNIPRVPCRVEQSPRESRVFFNAFFWKIRETIHISKGNKRGNCGIGGNPVWGIGDIKISREKNRGVFPKGIGE